MTGGRAHWQEHPHPQPPEEPANCVDRCGLACKPKWGVLGVPRERGGCQHWSRGRPQAVPGGVRAGTN